MRVLFICRSNAARSQVAEGFFNDLASGHRASSAGTDVIKEKGVGLRPDPSNTKIMEEYFKVDISKGRRKQVTPGKLKQADKIIVLMPKREAGEFLPKYFDKFSGKISFWNIRDFRHLKVDQLAARTKRNKAIRRRVERLIKELNGN